MVIEVISNNVTQLTITEKCGFEEFYSFAGKLSKILSIEFGEKIDDFDTLYWNFTYGGNQFTVHYNIYLGISIFHAHGNKATQEENSALYVIKEILSSSA